MCLLFIVSKPAAGEGGHKESVCSTVFYHKSCWFKLGVIFIYLIYRKGWISELLEHVPQREEDGRSSVKSCVVWTSAQFSLHQLGKLISLFAGVQLEKTCAHVGPMKELENYQSCSFGRKYSVLWGCSAWSCLSYKWWKHFRQGVGSAKALPGSRGNGHWRSAKSPEDWVISNYLPSKPSGYLALPEAGTYPFLSVQSCLEAQCLTQDVSLL